MAAERKSQYRSGRCWQRTGLCGSSFACSSVPPLTSVSRLMLGYADAKIGSALVIVFNRSPFWGTCGDMPGTPPDPRTTAPVFTGVAGHAPPALAGAKTPGRFGRFFLVSCFPLFALVGHQGLRISTLVLVEFECRRLRSALERVRAALQLLFSTNP